MTFWGPKWCPAISPENFDTYLFQSVMFYDGARVYYQTQDYTGDPSWGVCAHQLANYYYPYISSGQFFGFSMFPQETPPDDGRARRTGNATAACAE